MTLVCTLPILSNYLEEFLIVSGFQDHCPNGIQVEGKHEIKKIAVAVSASLKTIEQAASLNVDALIVHHGLFWNRDSYAITGVKKEKIAVLLENKISLLAYHLPLDAHPQVGNNWKAAIDLGFFDIEPFGFYNGRPIGIKGSFNEKSIDEFKGDLENYYGHIATCALGGPKRVKTAALISGGAYKELAGAASANVDCFITGSFDEPVWHTAFEEKINFMALGHSATERVGPQALGKHLEENFGVEVVFIDEPNPF